MKIDYEKLELFERRLTQLRLSGIVNNKNKLLYFRPKSMKIS